MNSEQTEIKTPDKELKNLGSFIGTTQYFRDSFFKESVYTEGIKYIMENGYSWLVTDILSVIKFNVKNVKSESFLAIQLVVNFEEKSAVVLYTDGNDNTLYRQAYGFTDAKKNLSLYYVDNVLMLSGEY